MSIVVLFRDRKDDENNEKDVIIVLIATTRRESSPKLTLSAYLVVLSLPFTGKEVSSILKHDLKPRLLIPRV